MTRRGVEQDNDQRDGSRRSLEDLGCLGMLPTSVGGARRQPATDVDRDFRPIGIGSRLILLGRGYRTRHCEIQQRLPIDGIATTQGHHLLPNPPCHLLAAAGLQRIEYVAQPTGQVLAFRRTESARGHGGCTDAQP